MAFSIPLGSTVEDELKLLNKVAFELNVQKVRYTSCVCGPVTWLTESHSTQIVSLSTQSNDVQAPIRRLISCRRHCCTLWYNHHPTSVRFVCNVILIILTNLSRHVEQWGEFRSYIVGHDLTWFHKRSLIWGSKWSLGKLHYLLARYPPAIESVLWVICEW